MSQESVELIEDPVEADIQSSTDATRVMSQRLNELLPQFGSVLDSLESGVFISASSHLKLYKEMSRHHDAYMTLVGMMGHDLIHHTTGFYYLRPRESQNLSLRERQAAASIFCLIEYLSDKGLSIESLVTTEEPITPDDIDGLFDQHRDRLATLKMETRDAFVQEGLKKLIDSGVLVEFRQSGDKTSYIMGIPAYYYIDIARRISKSRQTQAEIADEALLAEHAR